MAEIGEFAQNEYNKETVINRYLNFFRVCVKKLYSSNEKLKSLGNTHKIQARDRSSYTFE